MTWNYRIVQHRDELEETVFGIHEVHYDENGKITSFTEEAVIVGTDLLELSETLNKIGKAFDKPVLNIDNILEK